MPIARIPIALFRSLPKAGRRELVPREGNLVCPDRSLAGRETGAINANVLDLGLSESTAQDSMLMLGYKSGSGLGIEGGIKSFSVELNDSESLNTNLEYDGVFLNGYFNF